MKFQGGASSNSFMVNGSIFPVAAYGLDNRVFLDATDSVQLIFYGAAALLSNEGKSLYKVVTVATMVKLLSGQVAAVVDILHYKFGEDSQEPLLVTYPLNPLASVKLVYISRTTVLQNHQGPGRLVLDRCVRSWGVMKSTIMRDGGAPNADYDALSDDEGAPNAENDALSDDEGAPNAEIDALSDDEGAPNAENGARPKSTRLLRPRMKPLENQPVLMAPVEAPGAQTAKAKKNARNYRKEAAKRASKKAVTAAEAAKKAEKKKKDLETVLKKPTVRSINGLDADELDQAFAANNLGQRPSFLTQSRKMLIEYLFPEKRGSSCDAPVDIDFESGHTSDEPFVVHDDSGTDVHKRAVRETPASGDMNVSSIIALLRAEMKSLKEDVNANVDKKLDGITQPKEHCERGREREWKSKSRDKKRKKSASPSQRTKSGKKSASRSRRARRSGRRALRNKRSTFIIIAMQAAAKAKAAAIPRAIAIVSERLGISKRFSPV